MRGQARFRRGSHVQLRGTSQSPHETGVNQYYRARPDVFAAPGHVNPPGWPTIPACSSSVCRGAVRRSLSASRCGWPSRRSSGVRSRGLSAARTAMPPKWLPARRRNPASPRVMGRRAPRHPTPAPRPPMLAPWSLRGARCRVIRAPIQFRSGIVRGACIRQSTRSSPRRSRSSLRSRCPCLRRSRHRLMCRRRLPRRHA